MGWTYIPDESEEILFATGHCEDYSCCGHTPADPCLPQYYDAPGYYDVTIPGNEHNLCNHEEGECNLEGYEDDDECIGGEECVCPEYGMSMGLDAGAKGDGGCGTWWQGPLMENGFFSNA